MDVVIYHKGIFSFTIVESAVIVFGNSLILVTFIRHRKLLNALNWYILSLCVSGLITGVILPLDISGFIGPYNFSGTLITPCSSHRIKVGVLYMAACNTILCKLAIAIERWRVLSLTIHHRGGSSPQYKLVVAVGWIISIIYGMTLTTLQRTEEVPIQFEDYNFSRTWCPNYRFCFPAGRHIIRRLAIFHLSTLVLGFIVPVSVISIIYALLVNRLLKKINPEKVDGKETNHGSVIIRKAKLRAIQAMVSAVVVFSLCWLPGHVYCVWLYTNYLTCLYTQTENRQPLFENRPLMSKMRNDFFLHYVMMYNWIQTLIYPRYSRQLSNAVNETFHFLFKWVYPRRHRDDSTEVADPHPKLINSTFV